MACGTSMHTTPQQGESKTHFDRRLHWLVHYCGLSSHHGLMQDDVVNPAKYWWGGAWGQSNTHPVHDSDIVLDTPHWHPC